MWLSQQPMYSVTVSYIVLKSSVVASTITSTNILSVFSKYSTRTWSAKHIDCIDIVCVYRKHLRQETIEIERNFSNFIVSKAKFVENLYRHFHLIQFCGFINHFCTYLLFSGEKNVCQQCRKYAPHPEHLVSRASIAVATL